MWQRTSKSSDLSGRTGSDCRIGGDGTARWHGATRTLPLRCPHTNALTASHTNPLQASQATIRIVLLSTCVLRTFSSQPDTAVYEGEAFVLDVAAQADTASWRWDHSWCADLAQRWWQRQQREPVLTHCPSAQLPSQPVSFLSDHSSRLSTCTLVLVFTLACAFAPAIGFGNPLRLLNPTVC